MRTKFSDKQIWANSADPDQTAPLGAVDQGLHCFVILSAHFGHIMYGKATLLKF